MGVTMKSWFTLIFATLLFGSSQSSCTSPDPGYTQVSHGGSIYFVDRYGSYYRRYGNGYRPCPKPPGKPEHPIVRPPKPPVQKPSRPGMDTRPARRDLRPATRPSADLRRR